MTPSRTLVDAVMTHPGTFMWMDGKKKPIVPWTREVGSRAVGR